MHVQHDTLRLTLTLKKGGHATVSSTSNSALVMGWSTQYFRASSQFTATPRWIADMTFCRLE